MPYILGVGEIHIIDDTSKEYQYKHISNDRFFVIYKSDSSSDDFLNKVIKDIIDNDDKPSTKASNLQKLSHIPGTVINAIYVDYVDRRRPDEEPGVTWVWNRHFDWVHHEYTEGKLKQEELSSYVNSHFGKVYNVSKVLADYMELHSTTLWVYDNVNHTHAPKTESLIETQRTVIKAQNDLGLLPGKITIYPMPRIATEVINTPYGTNPGDYQEGFKF
ncbi:hypothetical protein PHABIO_321 [Pseudomonas phage Phabio]|uniref:Uncharacterized protein n=1 Tax=Pseudomonas phage Phabio TaxID=2006668 RepID=A0A1Y0STY1_9CAUD|nr:hypothetical protein MZD05_gp321 [Pseudomonas phage Phabio]ARV76952.1 hypothetical protein PHABIO_321 [Pseudomonas phage Phabio]